MRRILIILFITFSLLSHATSYYVSSGGNDSYNGTSELTPWKTIAKVNAVFSSFQPGDRVLFKCGDIFYGTLKITKSGAAGNPIVIGAYGSGAKPVIRGTTTISSWTSEGNGIYSTPITCESSPEIVIINGNQYAMGRWPNSSWATVDSHNGDISITDADLNSGIINWTGAEVVQRKESCFTIDRFKIANHSSSTITYNGDGKYPPANGFGYFIQNDIKTLDSFGEWYFNPLTSKFYMYFGVNTPGNYTVTVSAIDDLVNFTQYVSYITFDNIMFTGADKDAIYCDHNNYITIQNCDIDFSGNYAIREYVSTNLTVANTNINHSNDQGIFTTASCKYAKITGVIIRNTGLIPGAGECLSPSGNGMSISQNDYSLIEYCEVYNSGYSGISFSGNGSVVRNNFINTVCSVKEDGGGIYYGARDLYSNMVITDNVVLNALGIFGGNGGKPTTEVPQAAGIYLDYYTTGGVEIRNNTVAHCNWNAILLHGNQNVKVINNSVYDALICMKFQEQAGLGSPSRNITMNGNIFFAKTASQIPLFLNSTNNDFDQFGVFDNNYYARPLDNSKPILPAINWKGTFKSLTEWQTFYGLDLNSHLSSIVLTDTANISYYYNATKTDKVINLIQPMIDVTGKQYISSVTLTPFTSVVLMVDPNPPVPVIPVYINSVIQNSTPEKLEITYSVNLDPGKVPSVNDFIVKGTTRQVTAITISGTKVTLTLSGSVAFGEIITLSYTPGTNPLQTPSLGKGVSLTDMAVTNNLVDLTIPNDPPIIDIKNENSGYSGFVYEIDASGTSDANNDILTFDWTVPGNLPVSSTTGSKIKFLAPEVSVPQNFDFLLNVSDGRVIVSKSVTINISPYKPGLGEARIIIVSASSYQSPDNPNNVNDGNLSTKWSGNGDNQWLHLKLAEPFKISHLEMAFLQGQQYSSYFDVYASKDNLIWEPILIRAASCNFSGDRQAFNFPDIKTNTDYLYVKIVGHGNSKDTWNYFSEIKIFGTYSQNPVVISSEKKYITIYPNPSQGIFNVSIEEPTTEPLKIKIIDYVGRVVFEDIMSQGIKNIVLPGYVKTGVYQVQLLSGSLIMYSEKLMINRY